MVAITDSLVTYRLFSDPDGSIREIDKARVRTILWENGDQDDFGGMNSDFSGAALKRSGFGRFKIGEQKFSLQNAGSYIADPYTVSRLRKGLARERTAIALGVSGAAAFAGGMAVLYNAGRLDMGSMLVVGMFVGYPLVGSGMIMGLTSIIVGVTGNVMIKKAIRRYNNEYRLELGFTPTPGGLGLQLMF